MSPMTNWDATMDFTFEMYYIKVIRLKVWVFNGARRWINSCTLMIDRITVMDDMNAFFLH